MRKGNIKGMRKNINKTDDPKNNDLSIMFSHKSDHWATPKNIYNKLKKAGYINPCPLHSKRNNLNKIYHKKRIFINPPYSDIKSWVKFIKNNMYDNFIMLLIPARTDTEYFHELLKLKPNIFFIKGRLHFNDSNSAPFPSIILTFSLYLQNSLVIQTYGALTKDLKWIL